MKQRARQPSTLQGAVTALVLLARLKAGRNNLCTAGLFVSHRKKSLDYVTDTAAFLKYVNWENVASSKYRIVPSKRPPPNFDSFVVF